MTSSSSAGGFGGAIARNRRRSLLASRSVLPLLLLASSLLAACSNPPALTALDPPTGRPHDVIFVKGDGRELAQIVWDADTSDEKVIPGAYGGAFMFSVPPGTAPGAHTVKLQNSDGRSNAVTFNVLNSPGPLDVPRPPGPPVEFPAPRIDAVTLVGTAFGSSGVDVTLYVQGANIDVGATVWLQEPGTGSSTDPELTELATVSHKVLLNNWFGISSQELGYPIYHYSSAIVTVGLRHPGEELTLLVKNLDDETSDPIKYTLPADAKKVDSDGDGLLDSWETAGYDINSDGTPEVDLPAMGADPYRRDVFVELDVMDALKNPPAPINGGSPDNTVFDALRQMFESAPILNYGDEPGIHLAIDHSGKPCLTNPETGEPVCSFRTIIFDIGGQIPTKNEPDPFGDSEVRYSLLKKNNFDNARLDNIYHYAIWGRWQVNTLSGFSDKADDFVITFDEFGPDYYKPQSNIEAFAHELGHNLGQRDGGAGDYPKYHPNHLSVMSYNWIFRTAWTNDLRLKRATCLPFYYADPAAKETSGTVFGSSLVADYSEGMAKERERPLTSALGSTAVCGTAIDWGNVDTAAGAIKDFANWPALVFDGPSRNGSLKP